MTAPLPDPAAIRTRSIATLRRLRLPLPGPDLPIWWRAGDVAALRPLPDIEARLAVVGAVLARCLGVPHDATMAWLLESHLLDRVTRQEWQWISQSPEDQRLALMHREAAFALSWVLGIAMDLDPARPAALGLLSRLPDVRGGEPYQAWRARTLIAPRGPAEVAVQADLYACLDWAVTTASGPPPVPPSSLMPEVVGQRRLALEWSFDPTAGR